MIRPLLIALQFLTRLPVNFKTAPEPAAVGQSIVYYPLVGFILGAVLSGFAWLTAPLSPLMSAALLLCFWVLLTGGLHLDGLADSADAWAGGQGDRERMLAIMKDPASGPIGVTAVVLILLLKFAALVSLCESRQFWLLALAPLLGRTVLPALFLTTSYVRASGLGTVIAEGLPRKGAILSIALAAAACLLLFGFNGAWAIAAALMSFLAASAVMRRQIGGTTGDTAGALVELTETAVLVLLVIASAGK